MIRDTPASARPILITVLLLCLAAFAIRLWAVPYARFTTDERSFYETAVSIVHSNEPIPLYGPQITGSDGRLPGPIFNLVTALPFLFGTHPYLGGIFMALLHAFTGLLFFLFMRTLAGGGAAFIALALFAVAPWDILYSDRLWASNLAPVWGMAALYATLRARDGAGWQATAVLLALTLPQIHLSAPVLWAAMLVLFLMDRPERISWKGLLLGALLALLLYVPTMADDMRDHFSNLRRILDSGLTENRAEGAATVLLNILLTLPAFGSAEIGYHFSTGFWNEFSESAYYLVEGRFIEQLSRLSWGAAAALSISVALSVAAWLWLAARSCGGKDARPARRVLLPLCAGTAMAFLLLLWSGKRFYPHYLNLLMPLALAPLALFLDDLRRRRFPFGAAAALALFSFSALAMAQATHRFYTTVDGRNGVGSIYDITAFLLKQRSPFALSFSGFENDRQFETMARNHFGEKLSLRSTASRRFIIRNGSEFGAPSAPGELAFHGVRLSFWDAAATMPRADGGVAKVFGGPGGTPAAVSCERPARGLIVSRGEGHIKSAALICDGEPPRVIGSPSSDTVTLRCPDDLEFSGIRGRYDIFVSDLAPVCRSGDRIERPFPTNAEGEPFEFRCPKGTVIREMFGAAGDLVDRIGIACEKPLP